MSGAANAVNQKGLTMVKGGKGAISASISASNATFDFATATAHAYRRKRCKHAERSLPVRRTIHGHSGCCCYYSNADALAASSTHPRISWCTPLTV